MARIVGLLLAGLLLAAPAQPADTPATPSLAGNWKFTVGLVSESSQPFYLFKFEQKDGKWTGSVLDRGTLEARGMPQRLAPATLKSVSVSKGYLRFNLEMNKQEYQFEGRLPGEGGANILGNIVSRGNVSPAFLEPTRVSDLDRLTLDKEVLTHKSANSGRVMQAALGLLQTATEKKAKPAEVRSWADRAVKAADAYGSRWQRNVILQVAEILNEQKGFDAVALQYARQAERLLENKDRLSVQVPVLKTLATALKKSGKDTEAKDVEARIAKLTQIKPKPLPGRKGKSERVVLAELFTCSAIKSCSAAELAFNTLHANLLPKDVVLLEYHYAQPGALDPLISPMTGRRGQSLGVRGIPVLFLDGSTGPTVQGDETRASERYEEIMTALVPLREEAAGAKLKGSATRKDNKIEVKLDATDVTAKGESFSLWAVLVEDKVEYKGADGVPVHHNVVCSVVGSDKGQKVKDKKASLKATVDLDKVKKDISGFLKSLLGDDAPKKLPFDFKKLRIVAFVTNDETGKVLQTVQIDVK